MAIPGNAFSVYGVGFPYSQTNASGIGTREDVMNTLTMIDPDEAMTAAVLARTTTNGIRHEWATDALQATSTAGALQGDDWGGSATGTGATLIKRTRYVNIVMWFRKDWSITNDEIELSRRGTIIGVPDEARYQAGKAAMEVNRNVDARLWANGSASYGSATGADGTIASCATFRAFGQILGPTANVNGTFATGSLYSLHETMWTAGAKPDTIFCSPGVKVDISRSLLGDIGYSTTVGSTGLGTVRSTDVISGGEYGPVIEFIRTDFGRVAIVVDRWIPQSSSTSGTASESAAWFLVEKAKLRVAWWRPIKPYPVGNTGDSIKAYCLGALTPEVLHPTCLGVAYNVTT
jgi:uncharacterized protein DUF5309